MFVEKNEKGQSAIVIAFIVVVLLALVAVVVDVGNAYAHRRMVQNAVDAATLAGARQLAENGVDGQTVLEIQVLSEVEEYAEVNGLDRNVVEAWFIDVDGDRLETVDPWAGPVNANAEGVEVEGDLPFDTYFAHLLGFETMQATTSAKAWVLRGPCSGDNLFPIVVSADTFTTTNGGPTVGQIYTMWDHDSTHSSGNWGWINWTDGDGTNHCPDGCNQGPTTSVLGQNIVDTSRSGGWSVGDWVHGSPGVNMNPILGEIAPYVTGNPWPSVVIPIYDNMQGTGNNTVFQITGFAAMKLRCVFNAQNQYLEHSPGDCDPCNQGSSDDKCIRGEFVEFVQPSGQDGCMDTGVVIPSFRKPASP